MKFEICLEFWFLALLRVKGLLSSCWPSHFLIKTHVFTFLSLKKHKMTTNNSKVFNYVMVYMPSTINFLIFCCQDGCHLGWRCRLQSALQPIIYTSSCTAHHRLCTEGVTFSKYCNITKTWGGGLLTPFPSFL